MKGLHDNASLYPILPGRDVDAESINQYALEGDLFREAWEFMLSHSLTEAEGSAFWHGVEIQLRATRKYLAANGDAS